MAKLFKTSDDVFEFINNEWNSTGLPDYGIGLKVISTKKSKQILKLSKANATTEYLLREDGLLTLVVYEEAWDMLSELNKTLLLKGVFSIISFDLEHDKLIFDTRPYADLFNVRHTKDVNGVEYGDKYDEALEIATLAIAQIEDDEKERKEAEKEEKRAKKANKNKD